jgi:hypothetical protein
LGQGIILNLSETLTTIPLTTSLTGTCNLVYHKLVQYLGEVNGMNNVQEGNKSYTEVYAQVAGQNGQL